STYSNIYIPSPVNVFDRSIGDHETRSGSALPTTISDGACSPARQPERPGDRRPLFQARSPRRYSRTCAKSGTAASGPFTMRDVS
ncbi:hypothetical protein NQ317_015524, partial [Molorchus minor]